MIMEIVAEEIVGGLVFLVFWVLGVYFLNVTYLKPKQLRTRLEKQGIKGPMPSFLVGNVPEMKKIQSSVAIDLDPVHRLAHDYASSLFPYLEQWRKKYGPLYMYSTGNKLHLYMNRPDLVKEMSVCMTWDLGKPLYLTKAMASIFGNGVIRSNGQAWADQRKIIAPEFFMEKVKSMVGLVVEAAMSLVKIWEEQIQNAGGVAEIKIDQDLRNFSADVIARTCFGSSYHHGEALFSKLRALKNTMSKQSFLFRLCDFRCLPMKNNRAKWRLEKEVESLILEVVKQRNGGFATVYENDLLQTIMNVASRESISRQFIVDNCKSICFAGHDTTAITASWCLMLLASHPKWQDRLRTEVLEVCGDHLPDADALHNLKTVKMVIQETLRLYPPSPFISREVLKDIKIGNLVIPKGVLIWTSIPVLQQDPEVWGREAHKFNPGRFTNGISEACKLPQAYVPFGIGPRVCLGQNLAMLQLKIILSLVLSKFSFSLSSNYKHSPAYRMTVEPEHGVDLLMKRLS